MALPSPSTATDRWPKRMRWPHESRLEAAAPRWSGADLTDMDAVGDLIGHAEAALGPVSLLVNNASLFEDDTVQDFDWATWDRHFAVHVKAPALLAQNFARALPEGQEGLIVNIIDQRVWRPTPRYFSYTLSKSALWTATQTMAQALAPRVRVNAIGPGPTLKKPHQDDSDFAAQVGSLILKRGPELPEFGATIRYLWADALGHRPDDRA